MKLQELLPQSALMKKALNEFPDMTVSDYEKWLDGYMTGARETREHALGTLNDELDFLKEGWMPGNALIHSDKEESPIGSSPYMEEV